MTAFMTATKNIVQRLTANWDGVTTPIVYDNVDYTPVEGVNFLYFSVSFQDAFQASLYNSNGITEDRLYRHVGVIEANIFTALDKGIGEGFTLADTLSSIFRGVTFSGVTCLAPRILSGRQTVFGNGKWWSTPVFIGFQYDQRMA